MQLITTTFKMVYELRKPEAGFIFHSDRGAQYTSHRFQQLLHEQKCIQSFSNSGNPHDNAVTEAFFASYIASYNTARPHRTLKNVTPCQIEESLINRMSPYAKSAAAAFLLLRLQTTIEKPPIKVILIPIK